MGFLSNLVKVFPSLATRPLHLTGESYAGQYIVRLSFHGGNSHLLWTRISRTSSRLTSTWRNLLLTLQRLQSEMEHFLLDKSSSLCQRWGSWDLRYRCILFLCLFQLSVLATYPQIIGYDQDVYDYFKQQLVVDLRLLTFSHKFVSERTCVVLTWTLHIPRMGLSRTHH